MALSTYSELKASVIARMARTDVTDAMVSDYVRLAEADLSLSLKSHRRMNTKSTVSITAGQSTMDLPVDFQEHILLRHQSTPREMTRLALQDIESDVGRPQNFEIADKIYTRPSDAAYTFDLFYYKTLPPLATNNTNWLLSTYPQVYMDAVLYNGFKDRRNTEEATKYYSLSADNITRLVGDNSSTGYQMRVS